MRRLARSAFSLLEVMVALGILSVALFVLIEGQASAVLMTQEASKISVATALAQEKMSECVLLLESEGFQEQDINEEGDFEDGIFSEFQAGGLDGTFDEVNEETYADYHWAYTIREVQIGLSGDIASMASSFAGSGMAGEEVQEASQTQDAQMDLGDLGVSDDMLTEQLSPFVREIRVLVWWGSEDIDVEEDDDWVELVTHVVNPSGNVVSGTQQ
ncbi:MAG: prepilin-type N-terminal cleavage/methylation domain-containing protein [Myxococcota bacterium]|nr:prepilin-type N-terminal cleavage/methylation domain-containing protein [Myxococcota bacterium]